MHANFHNANASHWLGRSGVGGRWERALPSHWVGIKCVEKACLPVGDFRVRDYGVGAGVCVCVYSCRIRRQLERPTDICVLCTGTAPENAKWWHASTNPDQLCLHACVGAWCLSDNVRTCAPKVVHALAVAAWLTRFLHTPTTRCLTQKK